MAGEAVAMVTLNRGSDDQMECYGYRSSGWRMAGFVLMVALSGGLLLLVMYWRPDWFVKLTKSRCPLAHADTVLLKSTHGGLFPEPVVTENIKDQVPRYQSNTSNAAMEWSPAEFLTETEATQEGDDDTTVLTFRHRAYFKYFDHRHARYVWDNVLKSFKKLRGLDTGELTCAMIHDNFGDGLPEEIQTQKLFVYGKNAIVVRVTSYWKLFIQEVLNPFYIFQICSMILWSLDEYYIYASCIFLISAISMGVELYETRKQQSTLRDMVVSRDNTVTVCRGGEETADIPTESLVPGDVIVVPPRGCMMSCDAVLLSGNAIVNESMLTGESVPVTKTPLAQSEANEIYLPEQHKRHTLFCGTHVIQTRYYGDSKVKAVVVRTGFSTAKGELVRSILYPKPMGFQFYRDSMKFILMLFGVAICGMAYSIFTLVRMGAPIEKVVLRALDIVTIVVPPALPAAMTVGTVYAQNRLKKQGIFCISPPRINMCGKLNLICFDKTGTLTEDGMDLWGVVPLQDKRFLPAVQNTLELPQRGPFMIAMATCHSLTMIDGEITGDPLDLKMFNSTNYVLEEPGEDTHRFDSLVPTVVRPRTEETLLPENFDLKHILFKILEEPGRDTSKFDNLIPTVVRPVSLNSYYCDTTEETPFEVGIVRQFTFSSGLQRMSVITRVLGAKHMDVYAKGAPEKIVSLCKKETVPENFHEVLQRYTMRGFRVIAVAYKALDRKITWHQAQKIARDVVESELNFLGLLVMENTLKPQTTPVIHQLRDANIRTVMVTGDNMLTAVSVARQCGMVGTKDHVIMVAAHGPEGGKPAVISWEYAETDPVDEGLDNSSIVSIPQPDALTETQFRRMDGHAFSVNTISDEHERLLETEPCPYQRTTGRCLDSPPQYHFAVSGRCFDILRYHFPELMPRICTRGTVFARMSPDQKSCLVENLQSLGYVVGMCGDGANDCGALKTAHAGISLSEAEASVASPFTSKHANIECVPTVIREGRAALVTSFGVFKYMALYSMVQFVSVLILYSVRTNLGDWMFLYIDLIITTTVAVLMGHTAAYQTLVPKRPPGSLVAPSNIFSILCHIVLVVAFQAGTYFYLIHQPWFVPDPSRTVQSDKVITYETTTLFLVSAYQYLMLAFIFSKGPPYRKRIWNNVPFLIALLILTLLTTLLLLHPFAWMRKILTMHEFPSKAFFFRLTILGIVVANFLAAAILETFIIPSRLLSKICRVVRCKKHPKNKYKLIEQELAENEVWPPVGESTIAPTQISVAIEGLIETAVESHS